MKYLLPLLAFLASCTNPEFVTLKDKQGNPIHTVSETSFFNTPDKASEWSFWYAGILLVVLWFAWKEFKSVKFPKKSSDSSTTKPTNPV